MDDASSDTSRKKQEEECPCLIMMVEMDDFIGRELWPWLNHWRWELDDHFWAVERSVGTLAEISSCIL